LSVFFYNIFLWLFRGGIFIASAFNPKAKKWLSGRKNIFKKLKSTIPEDGKIVWMHCASLGEFEQGRPVLEQMKILFPEYKYLITFFSPSGYEVQKNYLGADWVFYLPLDGPAVAKKFLEIVHPSLVIFVKYEFWYYYLKKIKYRNIPLLLISALFREDMPFFKWYGGLQQKMLSRFDHLFVQTQNSKKLIDEIGLSEICTVSGDTRFDRVIEIAEKFEPIKVVEDFIGTGKAIIAGSTWKEDEEALRKAFVEINDPSLKLIIAPHEINENHLNELQNIFPESIRYSQLQTSKLKPENNCLIIDNVGMLSRLYKYGFITYVGGGLRSSGVHNVLEAAVYNKIVLFGPNYQKYTEAIDLIKSGGGITFINNSEEGATLKKVIENLRTNEAEYNSRSEAAGAFIYSKRGATNKIIKFIQEKRLLTN